MKIPSKFQFVFYRFYDGMYDTYSSFEEAIPNAVSIKDPQLHAEFSAYLDDLTSGQYTVKQIYELWLNSGSAYAPRDGDGVLMILKLMRAAMD